MMLQKSSDGLPDKPWRRWVGGTVVIVGGIIAIGAWALSLPTFPDWMGFNHKTLWDLLELLGVVAVPIVLAVFGVWVSLQQKEERRLALENQREKVLQAYMDCITDLLLKEGLLDSVANDKVRVVAHAHTHAVLRQLDGGRMGRAVLFLRDAHLVTGHLPIITLEGAYLQGAIFANTDLAGANLAGADLTGANLANAYLGNTILADANFTGATLTNAFLGRAYVVEANLERANLKEAKLEGANLARARFEGTNLQGAYLIKARLEGANLSRADLADANLRGAHLAAGIFLKANLIKATRESTRIVKADLREANFTKANLTDARVPKGFVPPADAIGIPEYEDELAW